MSAPQRIQLRRTKGWRMPDGTVKVDRSSKWGNPCRVVKRPLDTNEYATAEEAVAAFRHDIMHPEELPWPILTIEEIRRELRGKSLACWCKPGDPCHADVLLEIANSQEVPHD